MPGPYSTGNTTEGTGQGADTSKHPGWKAEAPTNFEYGPADPHSKRTIDFDAMKDPGVHEGIGASAAAGPTKGGLNENTKNT